MVVLVLLLVMVPGAEAVEGGVFFVGGGRTVAVEGVELIEDEGETGREGGWFARGRGVGGGRGSGGRGGGGEMTAAVEERGEAAAAAEEEER